MPDRMLKDGLRTSTRVGGVSEFAELLFVRLILSACPLGRCHADPRAVKQAALPNRPRKRASDIASALDELDRAGLIARYNAPSGEALLFIPRYGQRFTKPPRSPFPAPPGGPPDTPGQDVMPWVESPPERKKKELCGAPKHTTHTRETDVQWQTRLREGFPSVNLVAEMRAAETYVKRQRGANARLTRHYFEREWLPRCEGAVSAATAFQPARTAVDPGPEGWLVALLQLFPACAWAPGGLREGDPWHTLPDDVQSQVREHMANHQAVEVA